jgi:N-methylhydantoinase B
MPETVEDIENGEHYWIPAKSFDQVPTPEDAIIYAWASAGGYGDPIERDPEMVREDVIAGRVPRDWGTEAYGVVLDGEGSQITVNAAATDRRREDIIAERLAEAKPWEGDAGAETGSENGVTIGDQRLTEYLNVKDGQIMAGDITLGPAGRNWKLGALIRNLPLTAANPHLRDASLHTDHPVGFRQLICPETGRLLGTEVVVDESPPQWDIRPGYGVVREPS